MSTAWVSFPWRQASLCSLSTRREPWLRWSKAAAIKPTLCGLWAFQAEMICEAMGAMVSLVCRRGFSSQRQVMEVAVEGSSASPWMVTRMPAMVKVRAETVGAAAEVPSRGLFVAAMVGGGFNSLCWGWFCVSAEGNWGGQVWWRIVWLR